MNYLDKILSVHLLNSIRHFNGVNGIDGYLEANHHKNEIIRHAIESINSRTSEPIDLNYIWEKLISLRGELSRRKFTKSIRQNYWYLTQEGFYFLDRNYFLIEEVINFDNYINLSENQIPFISFRDIDPEFSEKNIKDIDLEKINNYLARLNYIYSYNFPANSVANALASDVADEIFLGMYALNTLNPYGLIKFIKSYPAFLDVSTEIFASKFKNFEECNYFLNHQNIENNFSRIRLNIRNIFFSRTKEKSLDSNERSIYENKKIAIILHGTWSSSSDWWKPGGNFWRFIKGKWPHLYSGSNYFSWCGSNSDLARHKAASNLVDWFNTSGAKSIDIIAHSHGGNVSLLASKLNLPIDRLFLMGTPIRDDYDINLSSINTIYNIYSTGDFIQTPAGSMPNTRFGGRTLSDCNMISNHFARLNHKNKTPGHSDLHEEKTWINSKLDLLL